ncbi:hypothetical protein CesoFtcFv8_000035 [Champsocephalus esox]|uniref:Uncharacterized protein n=1 Tax=Champsocephalus esox TaxID=159716 RepID=A0AAN8E0K6_9TELE|nr:hypothetical protein CesoFtcFv8_000035 [Champsocephalus esox]
MDSHERGSSQFKQRFRLFGLQEEAAVRVEWSNSLRECAVSLSNAARNFSRNCINAAVKQPPSLCHLVAFLCSHSHCLFNNIILQRCVKSSPSLGGTGMDSIIRSVLCALTPHLFGAQC